MAKSPNELQQSCSDASDWTTTDKPSAETPLQNRPGKTAFYPNLIFVVPEFPMLSETFILNQIAYFVDQGLDVRIVSKHRNSSGVDQPWVTQHQLMAKVSYLFDRNTRLNKLFTLISCINTDLLRLRLSALTFLWAAGVQSYLLSRVLPEKECVVICHFGQTGAQVAKIKAKRPTSGLKLLTFFHGADMSIFSHLEHHHQDYQTLFEYGELMLPISQSWAQKLVTMGCSARKIQVQHMGIEADTFSFLPRYLNRAVPNPVQLITVCRFVEKKGLPVLIECMKFLGREYKLTVIGDGLLRRDIEEQILNLGLEQQISLSGPLMSDEVEIRLSSADAFILPCVTATNGDMEGIPVALMEAMAKGLLVFSTQHSGIPELIEDGVSGYLVPENDPHQLADCIRHAFEKLTSKQRQQVADTARNTIETSFNVELLNSTLLSKITQLTGSRR